MTLTIVCDICEHKLGLADDATLQVPMTGAMFGPPEPGYPAPFPVEADWLHLHCPMCGYRPFVVPDWVTTLERGSYQVPYSRAAAQPEINALQAQLEGEPGPEDTDGGPTDPAAQTPAAPDHAGADSQVADPQAALDARILQLHRKGQRTAGIAVALGITPQKVVGRLRAMDQTP